MFLLSSLTRSSLQIMKGFFIALRHHTVVCIIFSQVFLGPNPILYGLKSGIRFPILAYVRGNWPMCVVCLDKYLRSLVGKQKISSFSFRMYIHLWGIPLQTQKRQNKPLTPDSEAENWVRSATATTAARCRKPNHANICSL